MRETLADRGGAGKGEGAAGDNIGNKRGQEAPAAGGQTMLGQLLQKEPALPVTLQTEDVEAVFRGKERPAFKDFSADFSADFSDLDGVVQRRRHEMMESSSSGSQTPDYDKINEQEAKAPLCIQLLGHTQCTGDVLTLGPPHRFFSQRLWLSSVQLPHYLCQSFVLSDTTSSS
ncbi:hypothetical protein NQZ68_010228 [Dissostichus eleginoides]|nr:hypothetical protein NQZ68_010228 [Dissostichus eleginoides]